MVRFSCVPERASICARPQLLLDASSGRRGQAAALKAR
jgi:hypothetical protein